MQNIYIYFAFIFSTPNEVSLFVFFGSYSSSFHPLPPLFHKYIYIFVEKKGLLRWGGRKEEEKAPLRLKKKK